MIALDIAFLRVSGNLKKFSGIGGYNLDFYRSVNSPAWTTMRMIQKELGSIKLDVANDMRIYK